MCRNVQMRGPGKGVRAIVSELMKFRPLLLFHKSVKFANVVPQFGRKCKRG